MPKPSKLIVLDTETSGLRAGLHDDRAQDLVQLGGATFDLETQEEIASYESLVRWVRPQNASVVALGISGLRPEDIDLAPPAEVVVPAMEAALISSQFAADPGARLSPEYLILGQHLQFDLAFLAPVYERAGRDVSRLGRNLQDTRMLARFLIDHGLLQTDGYSTSLDPVLQSLGMQRTGATHGALEDARLTARVYFEFSRIQRSVLARAQEYDRMESFLRDRGLWDEFCRPETLAQSACRMRGRR